MTCVLHATKPTPCSSSSRVALVSLSLRHVAMRTSTLDRLVWMHLEPKSSMSAERNPLRRGHHHIKLGQRQVSAHRLKVGRDPRHGTPTVSGLVAQEYERKTLVTTLVVLPLVLVAASATTALVRCRHLRSSLGLRRSYSDRLLLILRPLLTASGSQPRWGRLAARAHARGRRSKGSLG
jgi:hypothetical protein